MRLFSTTIALAAALSASLPVSAAGLRPDQAAFRGLYKELVETNTSLSVGSCTLAAERMAARLKAAGYMDSDIRLFGVPDHPKEGGLVAVLPGTAPKAKAILLLAHLDVVEAKREDWTRDPFVLVEENGYFYGRGASDDKAHAAIFTDTMIRLKAAGTKLRRPLKLALTCGEESDGAFNGAHWLASEHKDWIDAAFALNEGSVGIRDANGKQVSLGMQAGEKVYQDFRIEATNPGGHSSKPRPDNAIYSLAAALVRVGQYEFPVQFSDTTRAYFTETAKLTGGNAGAAMLRLIADPKDAAANAIVSEDPTYHSMLRTTCVATRLDGGHANNALAQRAGANINCRMFPGDSIENVRRQIVAAIADPSISVTPTGEISPTPPPPPLSQLVYGNAKTIAQKHFPGVPMLPAMTTGATDGRYLNAAGIPTYGVPGRFSDPDGNGVHGLNERKSVEGLYAERDYLFDLIQVYANARDGQ
ncbi:Acetylornithine deacetylase/Succinyl-diaminopimelate desuccinylase [Sphingomonas sp. YR710]|uniref:M20/M25/M40 family metallo-hydrolase n=1 Tax=Sphingomonas sp. YR710 TaxID=1882773 RepID=UPI00087F54BB|nr:M20/M25/M40 family metallo-hydrolase [Sphingomonas sp. YR710]SDB99727.1 Acetylornithine deacetylase/Succinyl-diaminopimelate desuccinylase [Sphingomonas sp. YR710]